MGGRERERERETGTETGREGEKEKERQRRGRRERKRETQKSNNFYFHILSTLEACFIWSSVVPIFIFNFFVEDSQLFSWSS